jgi:hypothetical protein
MQEIIEPFLVKYEGKDTDEHVIEAHQYGLSVIGASKIYNSVGHFLITGQAPRGNYNKRVICYSQAPKEGSWDISFFIVAAQQYWLFGEVANQSLGYVFSKTVDALKDMWTGKNGSMEIVERLTETILKQAENDTNLKELLAKGLIESNAEISALQSKLIDTIPLLAERTRNSAVQFVAPVGKSCRDLTQFSGTKSSSKIDEADAEVIRSKEELEVGDMQKFKCEKIQELNLSTGHCELIIEGLDGITMGTINDPSLEKPHNVYTKAFDGQLPIMVDGKPLEKKGKIVKLYISDASTYKPY